jgi:hypothetical protein
VIIVVVDVLVRYAITARGDELWPINDAILGRSRGLSPRSRRPLPGTALGRRAELRVGLLEVEVLSSGEPVEPVQLRPGFGVDPAQEELSAALAEPDQVVVNYDDEGGADHRASAKPEHGRSRFRRSKEEVDSAGYGHRRKYRLP